MEQSRLDLFNEGYLKGSIIQEIFYNEENGFGVFLMRVEETTEVLEEEEVIVVGHLIRPHPDEWLVVYGEWVKHPRYGRQYQVQRAKKELPRSGEAVVKYLSSGLFPGVGKKTGQKIVDYLGSGALEKIAQTPEVLLEIPGVTAARAEMIADSLREHQALEQATIFLYQFGIGPAIALKIVRTYKENTVTMIKENPYRLIDDIEGIGFRRADEIARQLGIASDAMERFQAAALFAVKDASLSKGHVYLTAEQLQEELVALLDDLTEHFPEEQCRKYLLSMAEEGQLIKEEDRYYLPSLYYAEYGVASQLKKLLEPEVKKFPVHEMYRAVGEVEEELNVAYADRQREADDDGTYLSADDLDRWSRNGKNDGDPRDLSSVCTPS